MIRLGISTPALNVLADRSSTAVLTMTLQDAVALDTGVLGVAAPTWLSCDLRVPTPVQTSPALLLGLSSVGLLAALPRRRRR